MTCEWVEGNLSAYLDDALDPQVREDVGSHLDQCAHCQALLEDYHRDERLLRALPTVSPDDRLRERIFESRDYADITRRIMASKRSRRSRMMRASLPAAALIALALGAGLVVRAHFTPQTASKGAGDTHTIGAPNSFSYPLAPGARVIFPRDGALWSAPEAPASAAATASAPQRLTPASAQVVAWSVAPASGAQGGRLVAWVDGKTGELHLVRADGLTDQVVARLAPAGQAVSPSTQLSLVWSPDGARLAFVSEDASGSLALRTLTVSGLDTTSGVQISAETAISPLAATPVWSADSQALVWATVSGGGSESVWTLRNGAASQVALRADPDVAQASITALGWSGNSVTWATASGGQITGVFAAIPSATGATRLTPSGARYMRAAFGAGGEWLLAGKGALWRVTPGAGAPVRVATINGQASQIIWAPDGKAAALLTTSGSATGQTTQVALWSPAAGLTQLAVSAASDVAPAWSLDSQRLAYVAGGQAVITRIQGGRVVGSVNAGVIAAPARLAWAPDGGSVAIADQRGVYLATSDGATLTLLTSRPPFPNGLTWSTAG